MDTVASIILMIDVLSSDDRFKLRMHEIQLDNQLPFSPMPVLFRPHPVVDQSDFILKFSLTLQADNSLDYCVYPYVGLQVCIFGLYMKSCDFLIFERLACTVSCAPIMNLTCSYDVIGPWQFIIFSL